ncbi:MAG TPA: hypothetical protein GXZ90_08310 [Clostridiales bacterium]|nr:hypothetical protein [Clostridiales bacterium]
MRFIDYFKKVRNDYIINQVNNLKRARVKEIKLKDLEVSNKENDFIIIN